MVEPTMSPEQQQEPSKPRVQVIMDDYEEEEPQQEEFKSDARQIIPSKPPSPKRRARPLAMILATKLANKNKKK